VKVYGGNGSRVKNSGHSARKPESAGGNNINHSNNGNNTGRNVRGEASQPKKKKGGKAVLIVFLIIALIVGGMFIYWKVTTEPPDIGDNIQTDSNENNQPVDPKASPEITDTATREIGRFYTVLVVGKDQIQSNTDTIMLARYDAVEHNVNVISIPRDTLVNVPSKVKKINTVYYNDNGGIEALMDEVQDIAGFRPDSYVVVDTSAFEKIIDTLGGVYFDVPVDMDYEDPTQNLSIHIQKGYQWLNGENALKVYRFRHGYAMGDIDRLEVQHNLIKACAEQMLKLGNITKLYSAAKIISENSETNLSYGNMQWYAQEFLKMSMENINIMTLPGDYSCSIRGGSYVGIKVDEWIAMVNQNLNPLKLPIKAEDCNILYQIANDGAYQLSPSNFVVTNGGEVAGGLNSFYNFK